MWSFAQILQGILTWRSCYFTLAMVYILRAPCFFVGVIPLQLKTPPQHQNLCYRFMRHRMKHFCPFLQRVIQTELRLNHTCKRELFSQHPSDGFREPTQTWSISAPLSPKVTAAAPGCLANPFGQTSGRKTTSSCTG